MPRRKWCLTFAALLLTIAIGIALPTALMLGAADPPQAQQLIVTIRAEDAAGFATSNENRRVPPPPFTLEAAANHSEGEDNTWGFVLQSEAEQWRFLIASDGYLYAGLSDQAEWQQFIHIRPAMNSLSLHVEHEGMTLRVNGEIAWQGDLPSDLPLQWGLLIEGDSPQWRYVRLYTN